MRIYCVRFANVPLKIRNITYAHESVKRMPIKFIVYRLACVMKPCFLPFTMQAFDAPKASDANEQDQEQERKHGQSTNGVVTQIARNTC